MIRTLDDIKNLDNTIKNKNSKSTNYSNYSSIEKILQEVLGISDYYTAKRIANRLNSIKGVKMEFQKYGSQSVRGNSIKITY
jgi:predicted metallopeptidase